MHRIKFYENHHPALDTYATDKYWLFPSVWQWADFLSWKTSLNPFLHLSSQCAQLYYYRFANDRGNQQEIILTCWRWDRWTSAYNFIACQIFLKEGEGYRKSFPASSNKDDYIGTIVKTVSENRINHRSMLYNLLGSFRVLHKCT